jgi:hypothetical protein
MRGIGLDGRIAQLRAPRIVEAMHARRVAREGLGRCNIFQADLRPDAIRIAEGGKPTFAADARAGEDDE